MLTQDKINEYRANPANMEPLLREAIENPDDFNVLKNLALIYQPEIKEEYMGYFSKKTKSVPVSEYDLKRFFNSVRIRFNNNFNDNTLINIMIDSAKENKLYFRMEDINNRIQKILQIPAKDEKPDEEERSEDEIEKKLKEIGIQQDLEKRLRDQGFKL